MTNKPSQFAAEQPGVGGSPARRTSARRSPNFPYINLETAIARIRQLYQHEHRNAAPLSVVAGHWGYSSKSSSMDKAVAAVTAFGLAVVTGKGDRRELRVSERGLDIVEDERPDSEERAQAVRAAALAPAIHRELREKYGSILPSDANLRTHLIRERNFNPKAVGAVMANYRSTVEYAGLDNVRGNGNDGSGLEIQVGSFVQWTSGESARFKEPKEVTGLSDDGLYAFVKGEKTGLLVEELTLEQPPMSATLADPKPPPNPNYWDAVVKQPNDLPLPLMMHDGSIRVVHIPRMDEDSFEFLKTQLEAYRSAIVVPKSAQPEATTDPQKGGPS